MQPFSTCHYHSTITLITFNYAVKYQKLLNQWCLQSNDGRNEWKKLSKKAIKMKLVIYNKVIHFTHFWFDIWDCSIKQFPDLWPILLWIPCQEIKHIWVLAIFYTYSNKWGFWQIKTRPTPSRVSPAVHEIHISSFAGNGFKFTDPCSLTTGSS